MTTGQRKYGGPPPDWGDQPQPGPGHEVKRKSINFTWCLSSSFNLQFGMGLYDLIIDEVVQYKKLSKQLFSVLLF